MTDRQFDEEDEILSMLLNQSCLHCVVRYWSLILPSYLLMTLLFIPILYLSWNLSATLPIHSILTVRDGWSRQQEREATKQRQQWREEAKITEQVQPYRKENGAVGDRISSSMTNDPTAVHDAYSIEEIMDIPLERVNELMYELR